MSTFDPKRQYKFLWKLDPASGQQGYGLAATRDNFARVESTPLVVDVGKQDENGIVKITAVNDVGVLTLQGATTEEAVVVPKYGTTEDAWKQEFKLESVTKAGTPVRQGVLIHARTAKGSLWERLRCLVANTKWVVRWKTENLDGEYWRPEPTQVSAKVEDDGGLKICGSSEPEVDLDDWWMWLRLENCTGKELTVTYEDNSEQKVANGSEFVIIPKGTDGTHRCAKLSVGDDLASVTLKMTKVGVF